MPLTLLIMIDGLRPDAVAAEAIPDQAAACPNLMALRQRGVWASAARSVMPSITLPCHMSIFHSVPPGRHGVTTNTWQPMARPLPGLVEHAHNLGRRCGFFFNWEPLRDLSRPETLAVAYCRGNSYDLAGDARNLPVFTELMTAEPLDFAFVYFGNVDSAGHFYGWLSPEYLRQAEIADALVGQLLAALPADTNVVVLSDHGGHERNHGTDQPEDMGIVWLAAGPQFKSGLTVDTPISLLETAPTLARLLGLAPHPEWEGRCVDEAFA